MGEAADDIIDGLCCQSCGEGFPDGDGPGHPRSCCEDSDEDYEDLDDTDDSGLLISATEFFDEDEFKEWSEGADFDNAVQFAEDNSLEISKVALNAAKEFIVKGLKQNKE